MHLFAQELCWKARLIRTSGMAVDLRSYMILLVSPLKGLEIHPKGSDHPSWIGINLGGLPKAYRMSRGG